MTAVAHARLNTAVLVVAAGMFGGHVLSPHAPAASPARGVAFYGLMALLGAWRGWREVRARAEDAPPGRAPSPRAYPLYAAAFAAAALLLAVLAYALVHGD